VTDKRVIIFAAVSSGTFIALGAVCYAAYGEAVQADHTKHTLEAPATDRLTLEYDEQLSNFAFNSYIGAATAW